MYGNKEETCLILGGELEDIFLYVQNSLKSIHPSVRYVASVIQIPSMYVRWYGMKRTFSCVKRPCVQTPCATHGKLSQLCTLGIHTNTHLIIVPLQGDDILITMIILWSTTCPVPLLKTWTVGRNNGSSS